MLNQKEILSTIEMIDQQHLDIRTITMGISLLSCCDPDAKKACDKIYEKITRYAENLVKTGEEIEREFGIPIVNKRISVTPIALVAGASDTDDYERYCYRCRTGSGGHHCCRLQQAGRLQCEYSGYLPDHHAGFLHHGHGSRYRRCHSLFR